MESTMAFSVLQKRVHWRKQLQHLTRWLKGKFLWVFFFKQKYQNGPVKFTSDSKWLGTQVWPLKYNEKKPATVTDFIGKGRQYFTCSCQVQGSIECVRFHIAEKRMKLKLGLGTAFYHWGFDRMGEEVSLQWTEQEEKKFKDLMRSNLPSQIRWVWNKKTRRNLVSYYFNLFLIQHVGISGEA